MNNVMIIKGHRAVINFNPEINLFRGEFTELNGHVDFYGDSLAALKTESEKSLAVFMDLCRENSLEPEKKFSGTLNFRTNKKIHALASTLATARGISLNKFIEDALIQQIDAEMLTQ